MTLDCWLGGYFLGFAATQLLLGSWLDRHGPKKVILYFLLIAVTGCAAFAVATSFGGLLMARVLSGIGLSACLMAPLTGYRRWFTPAAQMRVNSWMLMTGFMGMVASTLPVQWVMPLVGWRAIFLALAALVLLAMVVIGFQVPRWPAETKADWANRPRHSYAEVWCHPCFRKMAPLGFFIYGGLVAIQTLWATPWMIRVAGFSPMEAAGNMFWLNVAMLITFLVWGTVNPWLTRHGYSAGWLIARGLPFSLVFLAITIVAGSSIGDRAGVAWALYCISCTFVSLSQPAVAMAFVPTLAGRALSSFNLLIFSGVFVVQWGIGLAVDGFRALGMMEVHAYQAAMCIYLLCSVGAYAQFLTAKSHNPPH